MLYCQIWILACRDKTKRTKKERKRSFIEQKMNGKFLYSGWTGYLGVELLVLYGSQKWWWKAKILSCDSYWSPVKRPWHSTGLLISLVSPKSVNFLLFRELLEITIMQCWHSGLPPFPMHYCLPKTCFVPDANCPLFTTLALQIVSITMGCCLAKCRFKDQKILWKIYGGVNASF